ncbi:MAG: hypothetical protein AYK18_12400 [Theionarchaea archaeon DG-70]|nr:MAG: hypothetical protein AYK18_12400 [Theionarchaea archaeon DG-70]
MISLIIEYAQKIQRELNEASPVFMKEGLGYRFIEIEHRKLGITKTLGLTTLLCEGDICSFPLFLEFLSTRYEIQ